jgi:hypothetical protein
MSMGRIWHWTCDECKLTVQRLDPGLRVGEKDGRKDSANLADTERNEQQAIKRQRFSAAKSEMAYHNHFVLNSLGGNPTSAMRVLPFLITNKGFAVRSRAALQPGGCRFDPGRLHYEFKGIRHSILTYANV